MSERVYRLAWKGSMAAAHGRYESCLLEVQSAHGAMYPENRIEKPLD